MKQGPGTLRGSSGQEGEEASWGIAEAQPCHQLGARRFRQLEAGPFATDGQEHPRGPLPPGLSGLRDDVWRPAPTTPHLPYQVLWRVAVPSRPWRPPVPA